MYLSVRNRMKNLLTLAVLLLLLCACSGATAEEMASLAAKGYYEHLIGGEYDLFLAGKAGAAATQPDFRPLWRPRVRKLRFASLDSRPVL